MRAAAERAAQVVIRQLDSANEWAALAAARAVLETIPKSEDAPDMGWVSYATDRELSVMAGIRSDAIVRATGSERVVRSMPNTPALIGQGIAGLYARGAVTAADKATVEAVLAPTGRTLWVAHEQDLDAVTALSGSGPAYVFYFVEAMMQAAAEMGLPPEQGKALALATFLLQLAADALERLARVLTRAHG